jgi:MYXO-CTERM domain-containing protein
MGSATHWVGDADGDADADGFDFLTWQRKLGAVSAPAATGVPEPSGAWLAALAALGAAGRRRRRSI